LSEVSTLPIMPQPRPTTRLQIPNLTVKPIQIL